MRQVCGVHCCTDDECTPAEPSGVVGPFADHTAAVLAAVTIASGEYVIVPMVAP